MSVSLASFFRSEEKSIFFLKRQKIRQVFFDRKKVNFCFPKQWNTREVFFDRMKMATFVDTCRTNLADFADTLEGNLSFADRVEKLSSTETRKLNQFS